jgi:predicted ATPase
MQQGLAYSRATGSEVGRILHLPWLAAAYARVGRVKDGLAVLAEAQTLVSTTGARVGEAGLHVLKGWLLLACPGDNQGEAEPCLRRAIEVARCQSAKSLELGAITSSSRLWHQQGKKRKAHQMLSKIYNWFTEGFDTKDLQEARALLEELNL